MKKRRVLFAVLAVAALVSAACGGDRGEDSSGGADSTTETTAADGGGAGDFGDLAGVCGPNEGGGELSTAGPEETQGITEDTITLGTVSDPGFEGRPGLNQEIFDTGEAFVEWCNAAGGINGKQLELNLHDAAITEYQPVMAEACADRLRHRRLRGGAGQLLAGAPAPPVASSTSPGSRSPPRRPAWPGGTPSRPGRCSRCPTPVTASRSGSYLTVDAINPEAIEPAAASSTATSTRSSPNGTRRCRPSSRSATPSSTTPPTTSWARPTGPRSRRRSRRTTSSSCTSSERARTSPCWPRRWRRSATGLN